MFHIPCGKDVHSTLEPVVNYMLGPSSVALINTGARFPACMKTVQDVPITLQMGCTCIITLPRLIPLILVLLRTGMNNTANPPDSDRLCTIGELCGFGGIEANAEPDQWFRYVRSASSSHIRPDSHVEPGLSRRYSYTQGSFILR